MQNTRCKECGIGLMKKTETVLHIRSIEKPKRIVIWLIVTYTCDVCGAITRTTDQHTKNSVKVQFETLVAEGEK